MFSVLCLLREKSVLLASSKVSIISLPPTHTQLEPGDHILCVNGEDVKDAPRDHVIQLVRNCDSTVEMVVCQPMHQISLTGRKSTLLSPAKKSKLKARPIRVRFAESVCVNGSPLFPVSLASASSAIA